jgi:hypothetical protein
MKTSRLKNTSRMLFASEKFRKQLPTHLKVAELKIVDGSVMARAKITGEGNTKHLLENTQNRLVGERDFDKMLLESKTNILVREVSVAVATAVLGQTSLANQFYTKKIDATTDSALRSAKLVIAQKNAIIFEEKVSNLMCEELQRGANGNNGFELEEPFLIVGGEQVQIYLVFPNGETVNVDKEYFVETTLIGGITDFK